MITVPLQNADDDFDGPPLAEGRYLFQIVSVKHVEDGTPHVAVRCKVVSGPSQGAMTEKFYLTEKSMRRMEALVKRLGLVERGAVGVDAEIDEQELVGMQVVADVKQEPYLNKKGDEVVTNKWEMFGFWAPDDSRIDGTFGRAAPAPQASPATRPAQARRPAAPAARQPVAAAVTPDDDF